MISDLDCRQATTNSIRFKHIDGDPDSKLLPQVIRCSRAADASPNHSFNEATTQ